MTDLPDYYTQTSISEAEAAGLKGGLDANKSATPVSRDIYLATDTHILYVCFADGTWTGFDASILTQGTLTLYENMNANSKKIVSLAAPTADNDAARKKYVDDSISGDVATHAALTTGVHGVGAGAIVGTTLAQTLTNKRLTTPIIATLYQDAGKTKLITFPAETDTVVVLAATQALTNKTLTSPTINGTIATTGLTLPAFTLGGIVTVTGQSFDAGSGSVTFNTTGLGEGFAIYSTQDGTGGAVIELRHVSASPATDDWVGGVYYRGYNTSALLQTYGGMIVQIDNATAGSEASHFAFYGQTGSTNTLCGTLSGAGKLWLLGGLEVGSDIDCNSNQVKEVAAPTAAGDALIKGTRVTVAELPAMTAGKIWHGTGASPEEVDLAHGAARHTDVTREVFLSPGEAFVNTGTLGIGSYAASIEGGANLDEPDVYFTMKVPDDFVSFVSVKAVWICDGTGDLYWQILATWGASGEAAGNSSDQPALGTSAIATNAIYYIIEPANALTLSGLAKGDILGLNVYRNGAHASDTIDLAVNLYGLIFEYVAEQ